MSSWNYYFCSRVLPTLRQIHFVTQALACAVYRLIKRFTPHANAEYACFAGVLPRLALWRLDRMVKQHAAVIKTIHLSACGVLMGALSLQNAMISAIVKESHLLLVAFVRSSVSMLCAIAF
ncbi:hypothetical protein [Pseudomonas kitaguniensis]|uniref:hypothetical protein n=1 Tax=Pseudomonas kitaguniensis TaxID=2607908 RepID=UPI003D08E357